MGWLDGLGVTRRLLVEIRQLRRATERQAAATERVADALEQATLATVKSSRGAFRGWAEVPLTGGAMGGAAPLDDAPSSVSYKDSIVYLAAQQARDSLIPLLGREPTDEELEEALADNPELEGRLG